MLDFLIKNIWSESCTDTTEEHENEPSDSDDFDDLLK